MLNRVCLADGVGLVNVVRSEAQQKLLRDQGAQHVCNSTAPGFKQDLEAAIAATGATLCFDAVGGGPLAGQVLASMEAVFARQNKGYQFYGSTTFKQVYIYGGLDPSPTTLKRNYGVAWSLGPWLLPVFVQKVGPEVTRRLQARVVAELTTTFASHYTKEISLAGALHADEIAAYARRVTGEKYLVNPQKT
jgi:NADPH2:quinone reductase